MCCRSRVRSLVLGIYPKRSNGQSLDASSQNVGRLASYAKRYPHQLPVVSECVRARGASQAQRRGSRPPRLRRCA